MAKISKTKHITKKGVVKKNPTPKKLYMSFNYTDNVTGPVPYPMSKTAATKHIKEYKAMVEKRQGYWKTTNGERIPVKDVEIEVIPEDFNPYTGETSK